jgi:hypothetical protein
MEAQVAVFLYSVCKNARENFIEGVAFLPHVLGISHPLRSR